MVARMMKEVVCMVARTMMKENTDTVDAIVSIFIE